VVFGRAASVAPSSEDACLLTSAVPICEENCLLAFAGLALKPEDRRPGKSDTESEASWGRWVTFAFDAEGACLESATSLACDDDDDEASTTAALDLVDRRLESAGDSKHLRKAS